jgi:hypothetical protein
VITTTRVRVHPENETRLLSLPVDDTREQTARVLGSLAAAAEQRGQGGLPALDRWHALSDWLDACRFDVIVPFASRLADETPAVSVRQRRDFEKLLTLVKAQALLHSATRQRDSEGRVQASVDDYAIVRALVVIPTEVDDSGVL